MIHKRWETRTWAWRLELFVLILVVLGFALPYVQSVSEGQVDPETLSLVEIAALNDPNRVEDLNEVNILMKSLLGGLIVIALYVGHLIFSNISNPLVSTPAVYFFSPLIFGAITYYRSLQNTITTGNPVPFVTGSMAEKIGYPIIILLITFFLARLRLRSQIKAYDGIEWEYQKPVKYDMGWLSNLTTSITPFLYPLREILVCKEGILMKGFLFFIPLNFHQVRSVLHAKKRNAINDPLNLTTSMRKPVRIQVSQFQRPIIITPTDPDEFVRVCAELNPQSGLFSTSAGGTAHD